jgi:hypothetical protein
VSWKVKLHVSARSQTNVSRITPSCKLLHALTDSSVDSDSSIPLSTTVLSIYHAADHAEPMSRTPLPEPYSTGSPPTRSSSSIARTGDAAQAKRVSVSRRNVAVSKSRSSVTPSSVAEEVNSSGQAGASKAQRFREIPFAHMRVHFEDFSKELRLHRHHEYRLRMLHHQRHHLRRALALSSRLKRVGSWVHDGLVQISQQSDSAGFTRVHRHMQDLVNVCQSQWDREIYALDMSTTSSLPKKEKDSFFAKLSPTSQADCVELVETLRQNPRFLVERFKAMNSEQIRGLSSSPKFRNLSESVLVSLSENRSREGHRRGSRSLWRDLDEDAQLTRSKAYSRELEEYASSFERSNPLSFLIHNIFASSTNARNVEDRLRLETWSKICADLFTECWSAFEAIIGDVLTAFAHLYEWQIKDRFEMFLIGSLQRGAFLYTAFDASSEGDQSDPSYLNSFDTPQAHAFFDTEVKELFQILGSGDSGFPLGALLLGQATCGKLTSEGHQSSFRGHFFNWFLQHFLRIAITFPEVSSVPSWAAAFLTCIGRKHAPPVSY